MNEYNIKLCFLVIIILFIIVFIVLKKPYVPSPIIMNIKKQISLVDPNFMNFDIREAEGGSYTINKSTIYICTKDPKTKQYYSMNTLIYVCLHECAHAIAIKYDNHGKEFQEKFNTLIEIAKEKGIYDSSIPIPPTYCGLKN